jgi:hypothetical protein
MGRGETEAVERETDWLKIMVAGALNFWIDVFIYLLTRGSALRTHNPITAFSIVKIQNKRFKKLLKIRNYS